MAEESTRSDLVAIARRGNEAASRRDIDGMIGRSGDVLGVLVLHVASPFVRRVYIRSWRGREGPKWPLGTLEAGGDGPEPLREVWRRFLLSGLSRSRLLVLDGGEPVAAAV
jgi:hypothetical protein